jgi:hypothetical protein
MLTEHIQGLKGLIGHWFVIFSYRTLGFYIFFSIAIANHQATSLIGQNEGNAGIESKVTSDRQSQGLNQKNVL